MAEVDAHDGEIVVSVLQALGRSTEASEYAYDLLRRHFGDHRAHRAFWGRVLHRERSDDDVVTLPVVAPGSAVNFVEDGSKESKWLVLEDSPVPAVGVPDEIAADSVLARKFLGKKQKDRVAISEGVGLSRWCTIGDIVPKQVFRFRDVLSQWQLRFPEQHELWMVHAPVAEDGEPDVSQMVEMLKQRREHLREIEEIYREKPLTMHLLGKAINASEIGAIHHVASVNGLRLKCCDGVPDEWAAADRAIRDASAIVVAPTALATLFLLEDLDILEHLGVPLVVSQSTKIVLRAFLEEVRRSHRAAESLRSSKDASEVGDLGLKLAERLVAVVDAHCKPLSCPQMAHVEPKERNSLVEALGACEAESVLLASTDFRALWTDDIVVSAVGRNCFGVKRIWTQSVFRFAAEIGRIERRRHNVASAKLLGFGYAFTSANEDIVRAAGEMADWGAARWPLGQVLDYLGSVEVRAEDAVRLGALLVVCGFRALAGRDLKRVLLVDTVERLAKRANGLVAVHQFRKVLPAAFGPVDVFNTSDALTIFAGWWKEYSARVVVVGGR